MGKSKTQVVSENAGNDPSSQQAIQLKQAMNPSGYSLIIGLDGTDETTLLAVAANIVDFSAVSKAYRALYNSDLTADLTKDLSPTLLTQFWATVNRTATTSTGTTTSTTTKSPAVKVVSPKTVTAKQSINIRVDKAPYSRERTAAKGEVLGQYVTEMILPNVPNKGDKLTFVKYNQLVYVPFTSIVLYTVPHWVAKSGVTIK